jgi:RNA polymerase sigma-70 factor, ECF subfamily
MSGALQNPLDAVSQTPKAPEPSDEELMGSLRAEDANALKILFSRYSGLVFGIAMRVLHDVGEAEEIVQECFFYLYQKAVLFEPSRGSARVWIIQVAYSRARDRKAHLTRRGFYLRTDIDALGLDDIVAEEGDIEQEIAAKLDFDRLQGAFAALTEIQRETLKLFYFEEMGLREISERLHEPLGNVRHHFYRGIERLRKNAMIEKLRKCG